MDDRLSNSGGDEEPARVRDQIPPSAFVYNLGPPSSDDGSMHSVNKPGEPTRFEDIDEHVNFCCFKFQHF